MLFRRIKAHVAKEDWFAVFVDFLIVVVGVFLGIQIGNWNGIRLNQADYEEAHIRMIEEANSNIQYVGRFIEWVSPLSESVSQAVEDLRICRNDANAQNRINDGLNQLRLVPAPNLQNRAILQLTTSERLLERQSPERRKLYIKYADGLNSVKRASLVVAEKMEARSDGLHRFIDYGDKREKDFEKLGMESEGRPLVLAVEPIEACKDDDFRKLFYEWETGTQYQMNSLERVVATTEYFLKALGEVPVKDIASTP